MSLPINSLTHANANANANVDQNNATGAGAAVSLATSLDRLTRQTAPHLQSNYVNGAPVAAAQAAAPNAEEPGVPFAGLRSFEQQDDLRGGEPRSAY